MRRSRSRRQETSQLSAKLRAEGMTWGEIADLLRERYGISARAAMRRAHGWTQAEVALQWLERWPSRARTAKDISAWELWPSSRSGRAPRPEDLDKLARLYECDVADIVRDIPGFASSSPLS
jgi:hypothetical protein